MVEMEIVCLNFGGTELKRVVRKKHVLDLEMKVMTAYIKRGEKIQILPPKMSWERVTFHIRQILEKVTRNKLIAIRLHRQRRHRLILRQLRRRLHRV